MTTGQNETVNLGTQIATMCRDTSDMALDGKLRGAIIVWVDKEGNWRVDTRGFQSVIEAIGALSVAKHALENKLAETKT